jgi:DNA-binding transcriptional LysR family regulator
MDLRQLRYFTTLAETKNFHRAAAKLNISQPPLTVAIRKLEQQLGAKLFLREPRGVQLTDAGRAALPAAKAALAAADDVREAVRLGVAGQQGRLRLGFIGSATGELLPRSVAAYRARYPRVELVLKEMNSTQIVREIAAGGLDVGLVRLPLLDPAPVEIKVVERDELVVAMRSDHPLARRASISLVQLADHPFIAFDPVSVLNPILHLACRNAGFTPRVQQDAMQAQTILSLVEAGLGVALVPARSAQLVPERVRTIKLADRIPLEMGVATAIVAGALARNFAESTEQLNDTPHISIPFT